MELTVMNRTGKKKSENKKLRREGQIPAIVYSTQKSGEMIAVDAIAFKKVLQKIPQGTLSTVIFALKCDNTQRQVIVKDIHYNITTYDVIHIDFLELHEKTDVELNIPIQLTGVMECAGVKQGGMLRQIIRAFKVRCQPACIPKLFEISVKDMNMGETKKLSDIELPSNVRPISNINEIAVVVAKK